jgi:hypothetical protein
VPGSQSDANCWEHYLRDALAVGSFRDAAIAAAAAAAAAGAAAAGAAIG